MVCFYVCDYANHTDFNLMKYQVGPDIAYSQKMVCEEVRKIVVKMIIQLILNVGISWSQLFVFVCVTTQVAHISS